jgi:hypothetical protein
MARSSIRGPVYSSSHLSADAAALKSPPSTKFTVVEGIDIVEGLPSHLPVRIVLPISQKPS